jgi:hypothetical protein
VRWSDVEQRQPRLAATAHDRLLGPGVALVGTLRRDGSPRISPVEPFVLDGELVLSMLWQSAKAKDLLRDPRILVHSIVTARDGVEGELKLRGTAETVEDDDVQHRYADAVATALGWHPEPGRFHLFRCDIETVAYVAYDDTTGDQHVALWPPAREFVRRGTSATSVGPPQPVKDLLVEE